MKDYRTILKFIQKLEAQEKKGSISEKITLINGELDYPSWVNQLFRVANGPEWQDTNYNPAIEENHLDDEYIYDASLKQIRSLLTYCVREERFSMGFWAQIIDNGIMMSILKRIEELSKNL